MEDNRESKQTDEDANSDAYTQDRLKAAEDHFRAAQEQAKEQFTVLGEPDPDVEIPAPEDRDTSQMRDRDAEALKTQNAIASDDYEPASFDSFKSEVFDSPDINPDAKEFQLRETDEFTGPDAHRKAVQTGVNPRTVATSSNPEGTEQPSDQVEPVDEIAEPVEDAPDE